LGWFGYEYHDKITSDQAEEGGTLLIPIAAKVGWIAAAAFYLSFPAWMLLQINERFRKKPEPAATHSPVAVGSPGPGNNSPVNGMSAAIGAPIASDQGFSPAPSVDA
jgi:hypothetical protein